MFLFSVVTFQAAIFQLPVNNDGMQKINVFAPQLAEDFLATEKQTRPVSEA